MNYMGKILSGLVFCLMLLPASVHAQSTVYRMSALRHDDYVNGNWQGKDSAEFTYNAQAQLTGRRQLKGNNTSWDPFYRYSWTLNAYGQITEQVRENWVSGAWVNNTRYQYVYDLTGNTTQVLYDVWNGSAWSPTGKVSYSGYVGPLYLTKILYGWDGSTWAFQSKEERNITAGKVQSSDQYVWDAINQVWKKLTRNFYTYNQDSVASVSTSKPNWQDVWTSTNRVLYTYSGSPMLKSEDLYQKWDTTNSFWIQESRKEYTYTTAQRFDLIKEQIWLGSSWLDQKRKKHLYNANDVLIEDYTETFSGSWSNDQRNTYTLSGNLPTEQLTYTGNGSTWTQNGRITLQYNAQDSLIYRFTESYAGSTYNPLSRDFYYYQSMVVGLKDLTPTYNVEFYPVPVQDQLSMRWKQNAPKHWFIECRDLHGRQIYQQEVFNSGQQNLTWDMSTLQPGYYVIRVVDVGNKLVANRLIQKN